MSPIQDALNPLTLDEAKSETSDGSPDKEAKLLATQSEAVPSLSASRLADPRLTYQKLGEKILYFFICMN